MLLLMMMMMMMMKMTTTTTTATLQTTMMILMIMLMMLVTMMMMMIMMEAAVGVAMTGKNTNGDNSGDDDVDVDDDGDDGHEGNRSNSRKCVVGVIVVMVVTVVVKISGEKVKVVRVKTVLMLGTLQCQYVALHHGMSLHVPDGHFHVIFSQSKCYALYNGENHFQSRELVAELHVFEYGDTTYGTFEKTCFKC